ncbi:MAG: hypothetical protein HN764_00495 [Gammaproteobacteria bacterium]|jgi:hypothetical protein|nr:hypothetical protein [Gammaproteobacteria bacterium]
MKLSIKGLAITAAIVWSFAILIVGSANILFPGYGINFLEVVGSLYPGYQPGAGLSSVIIAALYGVVDAGIAGAIFAWLYNFFSK